MKVNVIQQNEMLIEEEDLITNKDKGDYLMFKQSMMGGSSNGDLQKDALKI